MQATLALAGKSTQANILASLVVNWGLDKAIAYLAAGGGVYYGWRERRIRLSSLNTERERNKRYERIADPSRTSSGLIDGGLTPPEISGE